MDPREGADPAAAAKQLAQADAARDEGRWADAAEAYWNARKADPTNFETHRLYQAMCLKAGDDRVALVKDYDDLVRLYAKFPEFKVHRARLEPVGERIVALEALLGEGAAAASEIRLDLARALWEARDLPKLLKILKEVDPGAPGSARAAEVTLIAAQAEIASDRLTEARKRLDLALATAPDQRDLLLLSAGLFLAVGDLEPAAAAAQKILTARPNHLAATLVVAEVLSRQGKRDDAIAALERPLRTAPDAPELLVPLADLVAATETEVTFARATDLYAKVITKCANHPRAHYGQAWILERQKKWKEAEEAYRKALVEDPTWVAAIHSVGFCMFRQGRVSEAQREFKRALDLDPEMVSAQLDLASTYDLQANYAQALKLYEKVLKTKGFENNLRAIVNSAFDHEAVGAFPKAQDMLLRAHKIAPDDVDIVVWLGDNSYFQEKWKDAIKWYQKAVGMDPKSFYGWRGLGFSFAKERRWADSVAALEKAKALKADDLDVLIALGDIYYLELEKLEDALKAYEAYVQAGGQDPSVPETIAEIKKALEE
jgi:tetratricopeptide (TPR) repeat protein